MVHWKFKVASSMTDIWQQLFDQQDITVIDHPWLQENHTSAPEPWDTDWNRVFNWHEGTCLSETSEGRWWAEVAANWNVVSNQQSFTDKQFISGSIDITHVSKRTLNICCDPFSCHDFSSWCYCFINKLTHVSFHKVKWEWPLWTSGQFCCSFVANLGYCKKLSKYQNMMWFNKVIAKIKTVQCFCLTV